MYLNFSDLPGQLNLFLDYIYEFENVDRFYKRNFRDAESYYSLFNKLSNQDRPHRAHLTDIIRAQYSDNKISKQTQSNIEALYSPKTIAVVTGQQLGIFGGPLYTLFKIITALKLCAYLREKYDDFQFVPIFWLEGDDHDFEEVRSINLLNNENQLANLRYDDGQLDEINRGNNGFIKFNENINTFFEQLTNNLRETEFKAPLIELLKSIYNPEKTFLDSFRELLIRFFDEYGLIVFNPLDPQVKRILIPVFEKEITGYRDHSIYLVERSAELEELYHAQVKVKAVNLFYIDESERLLLEPLENDYRLRGKRKRFTREDLLAQLNFAPERFSPNVLLRPICQDFLFPTAFYVGGPGEISYFAQVTPMYEIYNLEQPFIYPRSSATIVERGVNSILEKYKVAFLDIFLTEDELITKILAASSGTDLNKIFSDANYAINEVLLPIYEQLNSIDKTLTDLSEKSKQRIIQTLDYLRNKALEAEKRKHEATIRQIGKVRNVLYPNNNLQERELNLIYFLNKYGLDIIKWIYNELAINKFEHQLLEL